MSEGQSEGSIGGEIIEPDSIISVVVTLVILAVGIFAFSTVYESLPTSTEETDQTIQELVNQTDGMTGTVFSLLPIVVMVAVIGMIMLVVGNFGCSSRDDDWEDTPERPQKTKTIDRPLEKIFGNKSMIDDEPTVRQEIKSPEILSEEILKEMLDKGKISSEEYNEKMIKLWFQKK
jgi:uncharacterized membrane protein